MNMYIGENIRRLRMKKNITQERLADYLNISVPAVSKWERNETYPDITMLMPIASYFEVSTDELLGFDKAEKEKKIQHYMNEYKKLTVAGKWREGGKIITEAYKEFPENFEIIDYYIIHLVGGNADNDSETVLSHADELLKLCDFILRECTDDSIRFNAIDIMAKVYKAQGNIEKAYEMTDRFTDWCGYIKGQKREQLFDKASEEWWYWIQRNFFEVTDTAQNKLFKMIWFSDKSLDEKESMFLRSIEYMKNICEETGYEMGYKFISSSYGTMAGYFNGVGEYDRACKYYDDSLFYSVKFDEYLESDRCIPYTKSETKNDIAGEYIGRHNCNWVKLRMMWLKGTGFLDELRKTKEFNEILAKYEMYAKDYPE